MQFPFYPKHEHKCPNVSHCRHLGSAALGTLVLLANQSGDVLDWLHRTIDAERKRNGTLVGRSEQLEKELSAFSQHGPKCWIRRFLLATIFGTD